MTARVTRQGASASRAGCATAPDGGVEAHLEGPPDAVAQLVLWWRRGPPHAAVDELLVTEAEPAGFDRFTVR